MVTVLQINEYLTQQTWRNKMNRNKFSILGLLSLLSLSVTEEGAGAATAEAAPKAATPSREIHRGRMPIAIVAQVRFGNDKGLSTKELAEKYATTVGKIDDIKKGRNFAYVKEDFKPTQEQKDAGLAWLKEHPQYDKVDADKLVAELDGTPVATAEEAAALEATRVAARGQSPVKKDGTPADAGGGNRKGGKNKEPKVEGGAAAPTEDALLS